MERRDGKKESKISQQKGKEKGGSKQKVRMEDLKD